MPPIGPISLRAHAKLNLALSVGPPLADGPRAGFHPIASWFAPIDLHDTIEMEALAPGRTSRCSISWADGAPRPSPVDWPLNKDLVVRAHALLKAHAHRALPVSIR